MAPACAASSANPARSSSVFEREDLIALIPRRHALALAEKVGAAWQVVAAHFSVVT